MSLKGKKNDRKKGRKRERELEKTKAERERKEEKEHARKQFSGISYTLFCFFFEIFYLFCLIICYSFACRFLNYGRIR
jgi:hypothetical protein